VAVYVENPAMITAPNAAGLDPAVVKRGAPMRAVGFGQSNAPKFVAKQQQILAEPANEFRRVRVDLAR